MLACVRYYAPLRDGRSLAYCKPWEAGFINAVTSGSLTSMKSGQLLLRSQYVRN